MTKEMLIKELIDTKIVTIEELMMVSNFPSTETFLKGSINCLKNNLANKKRLTTEIVYSDYFSASDEIFDNNMFVLYQKLMERILNKITTVNLANEMLDKLKNYLNDLVTYDWTFHYENEDFEAWINETMNHFNLLTTKLHASLLINIYTYLKNHVSRYFENHDGHLKSLQNYLYLNIDMVGDVPKFNFEKINLFLERCNSFLQWANVFQGEDLNYKLLNGDDEYKKEYYRYICLGKISLIIRTIHVFQDWYQIYLKNQDNAEIQKDALYMLEHLGIFLYEIIRELQQKANINVQ